MKKLALFAALLAVIGMTTLACPPAKPKENKPATPNGENKAATENK